MIKTKTTKDEKSGAEHVEFCDNSPELDDVTLELVRHAMATGHKTFTTTVADGESRIDWITRVWFSKEGDALRARRVAMRADNEHFEILGPEVSAP